MNATARALLEQELEIEDLLRRREEKEACEHSFAAFVRCAWKVLEPGRTLVWNWHLDLICAHMEAVFDGRRMPEGERLRRLIVNVPYRTSKSTIIAVCFPAWVWLHDPSRQFLTLSHAEDLALRDATATKNLVTSAWYQGHWSHVQLSEGQNQKHWYTTTQNGHRNAQSIHSGFMGKGGDFILIDDPHDLETANSDVERAKTNQSYDEKVSTRLNDPATSAIVVIMQRLHPLDLAGHLLKRVEEDWYHLCIPMEYDGRRYTSPLGPEFDDPRTEDGELLWPARFTPEVVKTAHVVLGPWGFAGQMQQRPSPRGGGILATEWWKAWPRERPLPLCVFVLDSWDSAHTDEEMRQQAKGRTPSYSALTRWGVFLNEETLLHDVLMLDAWRGYVDFDTLLAIASRKYREGQPDWVMIEKKSSGYSLISSMRKHGVPIQQYIPARGDGKIVRAWAAQPMLKTGRVWYPEGRKWAMEVIAECADFPRGATTDYVDTCTQAWLRIEAMFVEMGEQAKRDPQEILEELDDVPKRRRIGSIY